MININVLKNTLTVGVLTLAMQTSAQAISLMPSISSDINDISANLGTKVRTANNPNHAALSWKDSDCRTCATSRIRFDNIDSRSDGSAIGNPFSMGLLRLKNFTGVAASGVQYAELNLSVLLWDTMIEPLDLVFGLTLQQTSTPGNRPNRSTTSDLLSVSFDTNSYIFDTTEGRFKLDILGWSNDRGNSFSNFLSISDKGFGGLQLYGVVSSVMMPIPTAVPVPAAAWLLGSGLLALAGVARRRQAV